MPPQQVNVLCVRSESGTSYGPFLFERMLDGTELEAFLRKHLPADELHSAEGFGWRGYLHLEWSQQPVHK